jgi:hypothetical protein
MWEFFKMQLQLDDNQVIWFKRGDISHTMEFDFMNDEDAVSALKEVIADTDADSHVRDFFIFCNRPEITPWATELGLHVLHDSDTWRREFGFKTIIHPRPGESQSFLKSVLPEGVTVPVPRGFVCSNREELLRAVELMKDPNTFPDDPRPLHTVCLKPVGASDGDGIEFVSLDDHEKFASYEFPMGEIAIEEKLLLDKNPDGSLMTVVTHYCKNRLLGPSCDQLIGNETSETAFIGNCYPSECPRPLRKSCEYAALSIIEATQPQGPGGFDFLFENGKPFLVDINGGRFNGGMYPKAFHKQYALHSTAYVSFKRYDPRVPLEEVVEVLETRGWMFTPILPPEREKTFPGPPRSNAGQRGIFPLMHLPGACGSYIAIASTREECIQLMNDFMALKL